MALDLDDSENNNIDTQNFSICYPIYWVPTMHQALYEYILQSKSYKDEWNTLSVIQGARRGALQMATTWNQFKQWISKHSAPQSLVYTFENTVTGLITRNSGYKGLSRTQCHY